MLSLFKKRASSVSSSASMESTASHRGLKPLLLVNKLLASRVIHPAEAPRPSIFQRLDHNKKKTASSVGAYQSLSAPPHVSSGRRSSGQTAVVPKRAPFVVPLHFTARRAPRVSAPCPPRVSTVAKPTVRGPVRSTKQVNILKTINPAVSRIPKPSRRSSGQRATVAVKSPQKSGGPSRIPVFIRGPSADAPTPARATQPARPVRSRIPVSVRRPSANMVSPARTTPRPARTPRTTPSRIPRLKYATSASSNSSDTSSVTSPSSSSSAHTSFSLQTPCPSPTLVVEARQLALAASAVPIIEVPVVFKTSARTGAVEAGDVDKQGTIDGDVTVAPSATHSPSLEQISVDISCRLPTGDKSVASELSSTELSQDTKAAPHRDATNAGPLNSSGNAENVCRPASADTSSLPKTETNDASSTGGIMGALIGELKTRLAWTKKPTVAPANSPFVFVNKSECRRSDYNENNNPASNELHQVLARRREAIADPSCKFDLKQSVPKETRRPLAPIPRFVNGVRTGHQDPVPTKDVPAHSPVPTEDAASSSSPSGSNDDFNPPGAEFTVTELITTPFGTRRVRRMIIPPLLEGSRPSRDPRIVMELNCLRAKQKVGGGAKTGDI